MSDSFFVYRSLCVLLEKKIEKKRKNSRFWASQTPDSGKKMSPLPRASSLTSSSSMKKKEEMRSRRRQRKEQEEKREETRPRESKLPGVLEPPLSVLSQLFSFIQSAMREERYKNARFVSLKQKESKRWRKELPPFHPLSSIDRSIDDSCMCVTFSRAWAAHAQKMMFYVRARAREKVKKIVWDV